MLGHVVVAGGPGSVLLWDRRVNKALAKMEDTHMDDVTQVGDETSAGYVIV